LQCGSITPASGGAHPQVGVCTQDSQARYQGLVVVFEFELYNFTLKFVI